MSDYANIPAEKQRREQWLFWNASADRPRKPLSSPAARSGCSWSDPDEWLAFDDAVEQAEKVPQAGIGYVNAADNDDYVRGIYGVIDLDGVCVDDHGEPKDWVPSLQPFFDHDAYIEWSPSGHGLHIPIAGIEVPSWWSDQHFSDDEHEGVEVLTNKFATYTGDTLRGCGGDCVEYGPWLDEWLREAYKAVTGEDPLAGEERDTEAEIGADDPTVDSDAPDEEWLTEDVAERALEAIDADCAYETWRDIGMALANHFGTSRGGSLFTSWSRGGSKWDSDAEQQAERIIDDASGYNYDAATLVYHAKRNGWDPSEAAREELSARSDGGAATAEAGSASSEGTASPPEPDVGERTFAEDVQAIIAAYENDDIKLNRCRQRISEAFTHHYDFVYPEEEVRGWRAALYVYNPDAGIYERRGERFVEKHLERTAGAWVNNTRKNEIVAKIKRRSIARGERFRTEPERLVVANGILDLHTGTLDEWTPVEYHRTRLDVRWDPDAGDPDAVDAFLNDIVEPGDVPTLYRLIAHTLYKEYIAEKAAILIGSGQNGKSVFLDFVEQFIGRHNVAHRELQDFATDDYAANNLRGKLANLATEIGEQELRQTTAFKKLTGRDTLDAPVKYESPVTFENYASLMFSTNEMPVFGQDNRAIWRRWVYVDFPYTFDERDPEAKDPEPKGDLLRRLTTDEQLEALLVRCQQEIQRWHDDPSEAFFADAMPPEEVREKMKKAAEPVYFFASACLDAGDVDDVAVPKPLVRRCYREFASAEDLPTIPENEFGGRLLALRDLTIEATERRFDGQRQRAYAGITLSPRGRQLLGLDGPDSDDQAQVDDREQATAVVLSEAREMLEANDREPIPRSGLVWRVAGDIGKATAENAVDELIETGRLLDLDDDHLTTK